MRRRAYRGREGDEVEMLPSTPEQATGKEGMYGGYAVARVTRGEKEVRRWRWVMVGTGICSIMIIVRGGVLSCFIYEISRTDGISRQGIYRSVELIQGWDGYLITHGGQFDRNNLSRLTRVRQRRIKTRWTASP